MNLLLTILAALLYTIAAYYMKEANGFAQWMPSFMVFALFCVGAVFQIYAMRQQEMTGLYLIFLGIEAICAFLFGAFLLGESITWQKVTGGIVVCLGVILLRQ